MIMNKKLILLAVAAAMSQSVSARDLRSEIAADPTKAAGYYTLYSFDGTPQTPAPAGYEPVYISHYGRHGSRWMVSENDYTSMMKIFDKARDTQALTPLGEDVYRRMLAVYNDGVYRAGALSPLGTSQHKGIASRMYGNYPKLFADSAKIDARATIIIRCVNSMAAFCESLKERNPSLQITRNADLRTTSPLEFFYQKANVISDQYKSFCDKGLFNKECNDLLDNHIDIPGKMNALFTKNVIESPAKQREVLLNLFYFTQDAPNVGLDVTFSDLFTPEELYWFAVYENYRCYTKRGPAPQAANWNLHYAKALLNDFITYADDALATGERVADLRFGHDLNIMAFLPLMQIGGYDMIENDIEKIGNAWNLADITPMASNIQFVFYRKPGKKGDVLVKVLHNEKEVKLPLKGVGPYYKWNDFKRYYGKRMASIKPGQPELYEPPVNVPNVTKGAIATENANVTNGSEGGKP